METRSEAMNLMMVPRQIVSPQGNKPVIGIVQDTLLGVMKFTLRDTFLTRSEVYNTLMHLDSWDGNIPIPAILKPQPMWTGKQIFSLLIPSVNVSRTSKNHEGELESKEGISGSWLAAYDTRVRIERGKLICGIIDKKSLGAARGSLVHVIWHEKGPEATKIFLGVVQKVVNYWLIGHGFSVGIGDTIADASTLEDIEKTIQIAKTGVSNLINKARAGKLDRQPGQGMVESFEQEVNDVLNKATNDAGNCGCKSSRNQAPRLLF